MRKVFTAILVILLFLNAIFADSASEQQFLDELMVSDIPIVYGDDSFRARILEKTKGERDPIGLVLTGGSARACAHIGVLRYLEQQGIVPDFIVSNSMGSIIGMLYAAGLTTDQIEEVLLASDLSSFFSISLPLGGGLLVPTGFKTLINSVVGSDFRLEDTDIPVMVVCDDLVTKREIRIAEGNFTDVLIGAFALPVYFDPMEYNGHLLVDGGVISLAPIDAAYDYSDTIILSTTFYDQNEMELINPITILNASFDIGKRQNVIRDMKKHDNFVWIRCAVENFSFMDFDKAVDMAKIGYESAARVSDQLSSLYKVGEVSDNMKQLRDEKNPQIDKLKKDLSYFDRVDCSEPETLLVLGFDDISTGDYSKLYLKDSVSFGLDYKFNIGKVELGVGTGVGFDAFDLSDSVAFLSLKSYLAYYPISNLKLSGGFYADFGRRGAWLRPTIYAHESIEYIPLLVEGSYKLGVNQALEYTKDFSDSDFGTASIFALSTVYDGIFGFGEVKASAGYELTARSIGMKDPRNHMVLKCDVRTYLTPSDTFYLDSRVLARFTLDGQGRVPLYHLDDYSSVMLGYGANQIYSTGARFHNTILGVEFGYRAKKSPTFGEFLIMDDSEVGLYCDVLISDAKVGVSTGVDLQTNFAMIGLVNFPIRMRLGYEYTLEDTHRFVGSILFNLKY